MIGLALALAMTAPQPQAVAPVRERVVATVQVIQLERIDVRDQRRANPDVTVRQFSQRDGAPQIDFF